MFKAMRSFLFGTKKETQALFLCSSVIDEVWIRTTAVKCAARGVRVSVVVCEEIDQAVLSRIEAIYKPVGVDLRAGIGFDAAADIRCKVAVTASSGIDRQIFPTTAEWFVHMPHSLASFHAIYPEGTFDGYDVLFASGPHHEREFNEICSKRRLTNRKVFSVGYGKFDLLKVELASHTTSERKGGSGHVLIAPSWGDDNLLHRCGVDLCKALLDSGYKVTVRPHPLFIIEFDPILERIQEVGGSGAQLTIESPFDGDDAIFDANVLIGDYSGISLEYFALRHLPVVSVDVGAKIANQEWQSYGIDPMESAIRNEIGPLVPPITEDIIAAVDVLMKGGWKGDPESAVKKFLFDPEEGCESRATEILCEMIGS